MKRPNLRESSTGSALHRCCRGQGPNLDPFATASRALIGADHKLDFARFAHAQLHAQEADVLDNIG